MFHTSLRNVGTSSASARPPLYIGLDFRPGHRLSSSDLFSPGWRHNRLIHIERFGRLDWVRLG
jgi:hypothetical protein